MKSHTTVALKGPTILHVRGGPVVLELADPGLRQRSKQFWQFDGSVGLFPHDVFSPSTIYACVSRDVAHAMYACTDL